VTVGPVLSREPRLVAVAADHPLAARGSVDPDELADYTLSEVATLPLGLKESFLPARTPAGRRLRRSVVQSLPEALICVASGEIVHATVPSFLEHYYRQPGVVGVPIGDMPPSETALAWLSSSPATDRGLRPHGHRHPSGSGRRRASRRRAGVVAGDGDKAELNFVDAMTLTNGVALYLDAPNEAGLPADRPFRDALRSHIEFGARVAQQNSRGATDNELNPLDHVPLWQWEGDDNASGSN
jgi:hypothetical protein